MAATKRLDMSTLQRLGDEKGIKYDGSLLQLPRRKSLQQIATTTDAVDKLFSAYQWRSEIYARHMKPFAYVVRSITAIGSDKPLIGELVNGRTEYLAIKDGNAPLARIIDCALVREGDTVALDLIVAVPEVRTGVSQMVSPFLTKRIRYDPNLQLVRIDASVPRLNPINEDSGITRYTNTWLPSNTDLLAVHNYSERPSQERIVFRKLYSKRSGAPFNTGMYTRLLTPAMPIFNNEKLQTLRLGHDQYHHFIRFLAEREIAAIDDDNRTLMTSFKGVIMAISSMISNPAVIAMVYMMPLIVLWNAPLTPTEKKAILEELANEPKGGYTQLMKGDLDAQKEADLLDEDISNRISDLMASNDSSYELAFTLTYVITVLLATIGLSSPKPLPKTFDPSKKTSFNKQLREATKDNADIESVIERLLDLLPNDQLKVGMDKRLKELIIETVIDAYRAEDEDSELYASEESGSSASSSYESTSGSSDSQDDSDEASAMLAEDETMLLDNEDGSKDVDASIDTSQQQDQSLDESSRPQLSTSLMSESGIDADTIDRSVIEQYRASSKQKFNITSFKDYVHFNILLQFLQGSRLAKRDYEVVTTHAARVLPSFIDSLRQVASDLKIEKQDEIVELFSDTERSNLIPKYIAKLLESGYVAEDGVAMAAILEVSGSDPEDGEAEESELRSDGDDESSMDMGWFDSPSTSFVPLPQNTEIHAMFAHLRTVGVPNRTVENTDRVKMFKIETAVNYRFFRLFDESMNHLYNGRYSSLHTLLNRETQKILYDDVYKKMGSYWDTTFGDRLAIKTDDSYRWVVGMVFEKSKISNAYQISIIYADAPHLKKQIPNVQSIVDAEHEYPSKYLRTGTISVGISGNTPEETDARLKQVIDSLYLINSTRLSRFVDVGEGSTTWVAPDAVISLDTHPPRKPLVNMLLYNDTELLKFVTLPPPPTTPIADDDVLLKKLSKSAKSQMANILNGEISQKKLRGSVRRVTIDGDEGSLVLDSMLLEPLPIPVEAALILIERDGKKKFLERFGQAEAKAPPPKSIDTVLTKLKYSEPPPTDPSEWGIRASQITADYVGDKKSGAMMSVEILAALRIINGGRITPEQLQALKANTKIYEAVKGLLAPAFARIYDGVNAIVEEDEDPDDDRLQQVFVFDKDNTYDWEIIEAGSGDTEARLIGNIKRYYFVINRNNLFFDEKSSYFAEFKKNRPFDYHLDRLVKRDTLKISFPSDNTISVGRTLQCFALAAAQDASHNAHYIKHGGHYIVYIDSPIMESWDSMFSAVAQVLATDMGRFPTVTVVYNDTTTEAFILTLIGNRPLLAGAVGPFHYFTPVGGAIPALKIRKVLSLFAVLGARFKWVHLVDSNSATFHSQFSQVSASVPYQKQQHAILAHALLIAHAFTLPEDRVEAMARGKGNDRIVKEVLLPELVAAFYYPSIALHWDINYKFGSFLLVSESSARTVARPSDLRKNKKFRNANDFALIQNMYTRESRTYQLAKLSAHNQITINDPYKHKELVDPSVLLATTVPLSLASIQSQKPMSYSHHDSFESSPTEFRSRTMTRTDPNLAQLRSEAHQELIRSEASSKKKKPTRSKSRSRSRSRSKSKTPRKSSGKSKSRSRSRSKTPRKSSGKSKSRSRSTSRGRKSSRSSSPATKKKTSSTKGKSASRSRSTSRGKSSKKTASRSPSPAAKTTDKKKTKTTKKSSSRSRSTSPTSTKAKKATEKRGRSRSRSSSTGSKGSSKKTPSKTKGKSASRSPSPSASSKKTKSSDAGATKRRSRSSSRTSKSSTTDKNSKKSSGTSGKRSSRSTSPAEKPSTSTKTNGKRSRSSSLSSSKKGKKERRSSRSPSPSKKEPAAAVTKTKSTKPDGGRGSRSPSPDTKQRGRRSSRSRSPSSSKPKETPAASDSTKKEKRASRSRSPSDRKKTDRSSRSPSRKNAKNDNDRRGSSRSPRRAIPVPSVTTTTVVLRSPSAPAMPAVVASTPSATTSIADLVAQQQANRQMNMDRRRDEQELANQQRIADLDVRRKEQELRKQDLDIQEREAVLRNRLAPSTPASVSTTQVTAPDAAKTPAPVSPMTQPQQQQQQPQPAQPVSSQGGGWFDMNNFMTEINKFKW